MQLIPTTEYRVSIDMPKKTIVIELEKFYGKYLFKLSHVPKYGKSKPTNRWYNYGEQPTKYDKYFEKLIDQFNQNEKERIIQFLKEEIRRYYKQPWLLKHYGYLEKVEEYNRLIQYLSAL